MGMFDNIQVELPLPGLSETAKPNFQTKDLNCYMDQYRIDGDGFLWRQEYEIEDHSDPMAEGIRSLIGKLTRINKRWARDGHTGEIRFYESDKETGEWFEYSVYLELGRVVRGPNRILPPPPPPSR